MTEINMDEVVRILKEKHNIPAYVEQTGGGCATIYAGTLKPREGYDDDRWDASAGPGWFAGPDWTNGRGDTSDFVVGPDDDGDHQYTVAAADWTEADVARELAYNVAHALR